MIRPGPAAAFHAATSHQLPGRPAPLPPALPPNARPRLALERPAPADAPSLEAALVARASARAFDPARPVPRALVARLLAFGCGETTTHAVPIPGTPRRRAAPSPGATHPVVAYVVAHRVAGVASGVYRYDPGAHALELVRPGDYRRALAAWTLAQPWMGAAGLAVGLTSAAARVERRYGARGHRYALLEAGHVAQNLLLLAAAHGLAALPVGGFYDDAIAALLAVDPRAERVLYLVALGVPLGTAGPPGPA